MDVVCVTVVSACFNFFHFKGAYNFTWSVHWYLNKLWTPRKIVDPFFPWNRGRNSMAGCMDAVMFLVYKHGLWLNWPAEDGTGHPHGRSPGRSNQTTVRSLKHGPSIYLYLTPLQKSTIKCRNSSIEMLRIFLKSRFPSLIEHQINCL